MNDMFSLRTIGQDPAEPLVEIKFQKYQKNHEIGERTAIIPEFSNDGKSFTPAFMMPHEVLKISPESQLLAF